jgi:hypothetical protein
MPQERMHPVDAIAIMAAIIFSGGRVAAETEHGTIQKAVDTAKKILDQAAISATNE